MSIESPSDLDALRRIGYIVALTVETMFEALRTGITTAELDAVGKSVLDRFGARPAPALCYGFAGSTMISVNEEVAHAVPGRRRIRDGDLVNIDVSAELDGYFADTGSTRPVGDADPGLQRLCRASREALEESMKVARAGERISRVAKAIRRVARRHGFSVIENLTGHGVGRHVHEEPHHVPSFHDRADRRRFEAGTVLTLEPFLSTGPRRARQAPDGWTLVSARGHYSAQFEHTVVITDGDPLVLTTTRS